MILIFGAKGWIGSKVVQLLKDKHISFAESTSRADDIFSIRNEIQEYFNNNTPITHIMSFIGRTHGIYENEKIATIDYLEKPGKLVDNVRDNLYAPVSLALLCTELNIHFTYLGTGCIFEYDETHPYGNEDTGFHESSLPNFLGSSYSIVKGFTDQLMHQLPILNVRIRMPITHEYNDRNFITKITNYKKVCSIPNSMTVLNELLPFMIELTLRKEIGTINLTNPGVITHNEILEMYKEIVDPTFTWENFTQDEQNTILLSKRSNNCLDTHVLQEFFPKVKHIRESVLDVLLQMKLS